MTLIAKSRPILLAAIFFVLAFDLAFTWQRLGGAYVSEFGGHPDEAAHYVTGLMVRDYVAAGFPGSPMAFAESYYSHYPKIGLGVWPPFFYVVQSAWTLPFGVGRWSILLLMAVLAAVTSLVVFATLRKEVTPWIAGVAGLAWLSIPLIREQYSMVMAEGLSAILMLGAALMFGAFLDRGRPREGIFFGILSGLAILTKGTGLALLFMAPLAVLFTRRWNILVRPALWGGGAVAALLAGPWTWKFKDLGKGGWLHPGPTWEFTREALPYYLGKYTISLGPVLLVLAVAGGVMLLVKPSSQFSGRWAAAVALIPAVILFQSIAPVGLEARHLIPATPPAMMLVAVALGALADFVRRRMGAARQVSLRMGTAVVLAAVSILILISCLPLRQKGFNGFAPLAEYYVNTVPPTDPVLVSSDARGEGAFIAEVAMRDPQRPSFIVQRSSKALAESEWSGRGYRPRFGSDEDLLAFLKTGKTKFVVLDDSVPEEKRVDHHDALKRVMLSHGNSFPLIEESQMQRGGELQTGGVTLFRVGQAKSYEN